MILSGFWRKAAGRFPREAFGASKRESPDRVRAFHTKLERRNLSMVLLLVKFRSIIGRLTTLFIWTRKGRT